MLLWKGTEASMTPPTSQVCCGERLQKAGLVLHSRRLLYHALWPCAHFHLSCTRLQTCSVQSSLTSSRLCSGGTAYSATRCWPTLMGAGAAGRRDPPGAGKSPPPVAGAPDPSDTPLPGGHTRCSPSGQHSAGKASCLCKYVLRRAQHVVSMARGCICCCIAEGTVTRTVDVCKQGMRAPLWLC